MTFTDYYSFLGVDKNADIVTIHRACNTKSRKLDIREEKSGIESTEFDREMLAAAYEVLTNKCRRRDYNGDWERFQRESNQHRVRKFVHHPRFQSYRLKPAYTPRLYLPLPNIQRGAGENQEQFFRRVAHEQSHAGVARLYPEPTSTGSNHNQKPSEFPLIIPNEYLKSRHIMDYYHQNSMSHVAELEALQADRDLVEHGIIPAGYEDIAARCETTLRARFGIMERINGKISLKNIELLQSYEKYKMYESRAEQIAYGIKA
ncbi:hypothetical protein F5884DRAFT_902113 [Xylogone sp. PMI_703]|nr:hypothetical protein F5884DRAFT_902113 [Xylogone sp. PMI_703]